MRKIKFGVMLGLVLLFAVSARADSVWDGEGGDSLWTNAGNWNPNSVPGPYDFVVIADPTNGANVTYNADGPLYASVLVDNGMSLWEETTSWLQTEYETIGQNGAGNFYADVGVNYVSQALNIGVGSGTGTYYLNNGQLSANVVRVGGDGVSYGGTGTFEHNNGMSDVNTLLIADSEGSTGTYNLNRNVGMLDVWKKAVIGSRGQGVFNQFDGMHTVSADYTQSGYFSLGEEAGGSGTYNLSGGYLIVNSWDSGLELGAVIGNQGVGVFNHSGGNFTVSRTLVLGREGSGEYNMISGGATQPVLRAATEIIGAEGQGVFNQQAGSNTVSDSLFVDLYADESEAVASVYNLAGGTLTANKEYIGGYWNSGDAQDGIGVFNQSGADTVNNAVKFYLGDTEASKGAYNMGAGQLTIGASNNPGTAVIGNYGQGSFNQDGGAVKIYGDLEIGKEEGSSGAYALTSGTLTAEEVLIGPQGSGALVQSGGVINAVRIDNRGLFQVQAGGGAAPVVNAPVDNYGTVAVTGAEVTFNGDFVNYNVLQSDPAVLNFTNLTVNADGYIAADAGDQYNISGNFLNYSLKNTDWNTGGAGLAFKDNPEGGHSFALAGADLGQAGYANNFAWGVFDVTGVLTLNLLDGNASEAGGALYTGSALGLDIDWDTRTIKNVYGNGMNVYYQPSAAGNAYLGGGTFNLMNGGQLRAVPEPVSCVLFVLGGGVLAGFARRRSKS